jgi:hypothetical protein
MLPLLRGRVALVYLRIAAEQIRCTAVEQMRPGIALNVQLPHLSRIDG